MSILTHLLVLGFYETFLFNFGMFFYKQRNIHVLYTVYDLKFIYSKIPQGNFKSFCTSNAFCSRTFSLGNFTEKKTE